MKKTTRRGFTLVEMIVVMAIVAILSLIGVAMLGTLKNGPAVDSTTQDLVSAIREAQNKAISVASAPDGTVPVAWGVEVSQTDKLIKPFYINKQTAPSQPWIIGDDLTPISTGSVDIDSPSKAYFIFTAPFGQYYSTPTLSTLPGDWVANSDRPRDVRPTSLLTAVTSVTLKYRNTSKIVNISTAGDVSVD